MDDNDTANSNNNQNNLGETPLPQSPAPSRPQPQINSVEEKKVEAFYDIYGKFYLKRKGDNKSDESSDLTSPEEGKFLLNLIRNKLTTDQKNEIIGKRETIDEDNELSSDYLFYKCGKPGAEDGLVLSTDYEATFDIDRSNPEKPEIGNLISKKEEESFNGLVFTLNGQEVKLDINIPQKQGNDLLKVKISSLKLVVVTADVKADLSKADGDNGGSIEYAPTGILNILNFNLTPVNGGDGVNMKNVRDMLKDNTLDEYEKKILTMLFNNNKQRNANELLKLFEELKCTETEKKAAVTQLLSGEADIGAVLKEHVAGVIDKIAPTLFEAIDTALKNNFNQRGGAKKRATKRRSGRRSSRRQRKSQRKRNAKRNSRR